MYVKKNYEKIQCKNCSELFKPLTSHTKFCGKECYRKYGKRNYGHSQGGNHKYLKHKGDNCEKCGFIPIHKCQLDVDHIDGNHRNNDLDNLQTLCANCHRLKTGKQRGWIK